MCTVGYRRVSGMKANIIKLNTEHYALIMATIVLCVRCGGGRDGIKSGDHRQSSADNTVSDSETLT